MNGTFSVAGEHPPRTGMTISTVSGLRGSAEVTFFSLGAGTDISAEAYPVPRLYVGAGGRTDFSLGNKGNMAHTAVCEGELLTAPADVLCGMASEGGSVYTEIVPGKEFTMNQAVKPGEVLKLADLVPYEDGSIVNLDVASGETMKFVVMAFDEGTGLAPHSAPGDALVFALEGKGVIGYEGKEYPICAGENFRFAKGGMHSVTADGRFKMALLLMLEQ